MSHNTIVSLPTQFIYTFKIINSIVKRFNFTLTNFIVGILYVQCARLVVGINMSYTVIRQMSIFALFRTYRPTAMNVSDMYFRQTYLHTNYSEIPAHNIIIYNEK